MLPTSAMRLTAFGLLMSAAQVAAAGTCYPVDSSFKSLGSYTYQSVGYCTDSCKAAGYSVSATTNGDSCLCSNSQPSVSSVSLSMCSETCSGYPSDNCGAANYMYVFSAGSGTATGGTATTATTKATTTTAATATTAGTGTTTPIPTVIYITTQGAAQQGTTIIRTVTPTPSATSSGRPTGSDASSARVSSGSGGIGGGTIAGIVIGVLLGLAVLGAVGFFFWRRRHDNDDDSESGRAFAEKSRIGGGAGAGAAGGLAAAGIRSGKNGATATDTSELRPPPTFDQRLDLGMVGRRNSSESLADNYDYSRKILRVVNH